MPRSIRAKFIILFLMGALPLAALFSYVLHGFWSLRHRLLMDSTMEMARSAAAATASVLEAALRSEEGAARRLTRDPSKTADQQAYLEQFLSDHGRFQSIYYLSGNVVLRAGSSPRSPGELAGDPAVRKVIRGRSWSLFSVARANGQKMAHLAVAVDGVHGRQGVLLGLIPVDDICDSLPRLVNDYMRLALVDSDGGIIYQSQPLESSERALISGPGLAKALAGEESAGQAPASGPLQEDFTACFAPVGRLGWAAAALVDCREAMAPITQKERWLGAFLGLGLLTSLMFIWWWTGDLHQSIRRLERAARAVAAGDTGYRVRISTGTEMDGLSDAFNNMAERLEKHQDMVRDRNQQLNVLLTLVEELRTERDPQELLRRITKDAAIVTSAGIAFLAQVENDFLCLKEWWDGIRWVSFDLKWQLGKGVPGWVWQNHDTRTSEDQGPDGTVLLMDSVLKIRNYICSPIILPNTAAGETVAGVLFVGNRKDAAAFTEDDMRIMELLARHAGVALEVEAAFQRERRVGVTLQKAMLPDVDPNLGGLSIAREYQAASDEAELGGDFYDVIPLSHNRLGLVIADVSGKGVPAAVQTAAVKYALRAYALENPDPGSVLPRLNNSCASGPTSRGFVTLFYGVIDLETFRMRYANAGHQPPLLRHANGRVEILSSPGMVLGAVDSSMITFRTQEVDLRPGDTLVLYTDGLSEARNGDDFLDPEGLQILLEKMDLDAHETAKMLVAQATAFSDGALRDDVALLVVKIPGPLSAPLELRHHLQDPRDR